MTEDPNQGEQPTETPAPDQGEQGPRPSVPAGPGGTTGTEADQDS